MLWWWENPCKHGHVFAWTSSTSDYTHEPAGNQRCLCGAVTYDQVRPNPSSGRGYQQAERRSGGEPAAPLNPVS